MIDTDRIAPALAAQLTIALAYVLTFRLHTALPDLPGTAIASVIFIPSLVRVAGTLWTGPLAFVGLFAGSLIIAMQYPEYQAEALYHAVSSAGSAPLTYLIFTKIGLLNRATVPFKRPDAVAVFLFIAFYAVMNAGLHLIGLSILKGTLAPHLPYFLVMVAGDIIPPAGGFALYLGLKRLLRPKSRPRH